VLRSWRFPFSFVPGESFAIEPAPDHRLLYLDYEGPVSNDRGTVVKVDSGEFEWIRDDSQQLILVLRGAIYSGRLTISSLPQNNLVARFDSNSFS